jgi:putative transposase
MSTAWSLAIRRRYGLQRVCIAWELARSRLYAQRERETASVAARKRGPTSALSDAELLAAIERDLRETPFLGEGYRKVHARLRVVQNIRTSKARVLRLMRAHGLLAPTRSGCPHGPVAHDRTIIPEKPDVMWGTDATSVLTGEGVTTVFIAVDHFVADCVGIHAARPGTRFEALEPIRQGVREHFGGYRSSVARGLKLRHDNGSQYVSDYFQGELRFLGIESSPSFVREPEGNRCSERFIRTLKEQVLWGLTRSPSCPRG